MIDTFQPNPKSSIHNIFLIPICCILVCTFAYFKPHLINRLVFVIVYVNYLALNWCIYGFHVILHVRGCCFECKKTI